MKKDFWLERWEKKEIGFHQNEVNPHLLQYWQEISTQGAGEVFVPLCGKTLDMIWLRELGHPVFGVELSDIAVREFFHENGYADRLLMEESHFSADDIRIRCGDFFDLTQDDLKQVKAVYDRASLVALPPVMRDQYVHHLVHILPSATEILLVTFDYPQEQMPGPPFAVSAEDITRLFTPHAQIRLLASLDVLPDNPRFQARGVTRLQENIYLLVLN
ncbi:MAG: thiopurine S-methyltransferase [Gallionella sp.]|jgi:thiopurine S-methyltransferase